MPSPLRRRLALGAFLAIVATGLMAPLASNALVPSTTDLPPHISAAWQARLALEEGQFPLRTAPLEREGRRYAMLQLYGQFPYTLAALLQVTVLPDTPQGPYVALKLVVWGSLVVGGLYLHRLARYLGARPPAALVAAVAYMAAPYLLVNLHARGALAEGIAQGLLPLTLYQLLRFAAAGGRLRFCKAVLAASAILLTHLITFAYSLAAAGVLILVLSRRHLVRRVLRGAAVAAGTLALCWYFVAPILALRGALSITTGSRSTMTRYAWVTPIAGLLSPSSVPPVPTGSMGLPPFIHPAIGLVLLAGTLLAAAIRLGLAGVPVTRALRRFATPLLAVFVLGLLLAWSPVDVWKRLPDIFSLAQFTYRQITLTMWSGALLLALALSALLPRTHETLSAAAGCTLALMASGPYLTSAPGWRDGSAFDLIRQPFYAPTDRAPYAVRIDKGPLTWPDLVIEIQGPAAVPFELPIAFVGRLKDAPQHLHLSGTLPERLAAAGVDLELRADGRLLAQVRLEGVEADRTVPLRSPAALPDALDTRLEWSATSAAGPVAPADLAGLRAVVAPPHIPFERVHAPEEAGPGRARVNIFQKRGDGFALRVTAGGDALLLLPLEYYPSLLDIRMDDARVPYLPYATPSGQVLAAVRVPAGKHRVTGRFSGLRAANAFSLAAWVGLGALAASGFLAKRRRRR